MADEHGVGVELDIGLLLKGDAHEIVLPLESDDSRPPPVALIWPPGCGVDSISVKFWK